MVRDRMQASQSRQKAYVDHRRKPLEFAAEDHVFLRVTRITALANLHLVFHVSQLRKYVFDPSHVLEVEDVQISEDLTMEVPPVTLEDSQLEERRGKPPQCLRDARNLMGLRAGPQGVQGP
ncbi:uncharacterized protein LOC114184592 [Vigna unguiculata]|uniref:uncharacterized protein LOC114184592 n=1 Tax=Vigna unguiculata TaxID=3917 RepID=UPI00101716BC|nr:uncharacterized protein LOC114184592 [Vigna unguiculata]